MQSDKPPGEARYVQRTAKLFEAGRYPDRNLEVSPGQLDDMAGAFSCPVPIRVEHRAGPLKLGWLVDVWREGRALFGRLAFTQAAWDLLKESGAKALSLGLDRETLAIREVSLVRFPRITSARVFSDTALALFTFNLLPEETGGNGEAMKDIHNDAAPDGGELIELRRQLRERDARESVDAYVQAGKIAPGAREIALAILSAEDERAVLFADGQAVGIAEAFRAFLEAQPPVVLFGESVPAGSPKPSASAEDCRLFDMLDVSEDDVRRYAGAKEGN